ncbi:MAG: hypothetical protein KDD36_09055 [Flavobacteriales bacterium]|nr:hypothetical protein [Flavobacteriales bacterium]
MRMNNSNRPVNAVFTAILLFGLWLVGTPVAQAQNNEVLIVKVKATKAKKNLAGVKMSLTGGKKPEKQTSPKNGTCEFILFDGKSYTLEISMEGHYTYLYQFDTKMDSKIASRLDGAPPEFAIDAEMFEKIPGFDPVLFKSPLRKLVFDKAEKGLVEDKAYTSKVDARMKEYEKAFSAPKEEQVKLIEAIKQKESPDPPPQKETPPAPPEDSNDEDEQDDAAAFKAELNNDLKEASEKDNGSENYILQLSGQVTELGRPIYQAKIRIKSYGSSASLNEGKSEDFILTQNNGSYFAKLQLGKAYTIYVSREGYYTKSFFIGADKKNLQKSYGLILNVELLRIRNFKGLEKPEGLNLDKEYDNYRYAKKKDAFVPAGSYGIDPEVKVLRKFYADLKDQWERYYAQNGRMDAPLEVQEPSQKDKKEVKAQRKPPSPTDANLQAQSEAEKEAESRRNKALKEEEERRLREEMEEKERMAKEEEERRQREIRELEQKALAEKMQREADAQAVIEAQNQKEEAKVIEARKVQSAKKTSDVSITKQLAEIEREARIKEAASRAEKQKDTPVRAPVIKPVITRKTDDGYMYDTHITTVRFPGKTIVLKEEVSLWGGKTYYIDEKEVSAETFKKELAKYNIN